MPPKPIKQQSLDLNPVGKLINRNIVDEMQEAYLDYAMSVIIARALPDVRDGLKPVHRRILYAMWDMKLTSSAKFRKSAAVIGEVLGRYHPHGDTSVYDAMVRMAQDFSLRYPLVFGQGNFGSLDGDSAAAYRYTEAKLMRIAGELLTDIDKNTVTFIPNYDATVMEPVVLPAKIPNLLLNGAVGIAVGMATSIPPHNLTELCDALGHLIDCKQCSVDDLLEYVKGPDFPTGGIIYDVEAIKQAYATGRGGVVMRAKTDISEAKNGMQQIIVSEIPFQVNKATVLEKIAELVREKKVEGIRDLRDESSKGEVRIVIELKKDTYPKKILNQLFKYTQLQDTFHFNILALIDGIQPRTLNLKAVLDEFLKHRKDVIVKRTQYDLDRAKERAHILEGLHIALEHIDKIIKTIKGSRDREAAKENLIKEFRLSERQTIAILEMRLSQLANLERLRIEQELKEKQALIKELESILSSPQRVMTVIKEEIEEMKKAYGDKRKTQIIKTGVDKISTEDLIPNEQALVVLTQDGYIKRLAPDTFKLQARGGKGVVGLTTKEEDIVDKLFHCMTHNDILFFTSKGRVFQLKAYEVPVASRTSKGQAVVNFLQLASSEKVSAVISLADIKKVKYLIMVTKQGVIKKTDINDFTQVRRSGLIAIKLKGDDLLEWVKPTGGHDEMILVSAMGQSIHFEESTVRPMGRTAAGVRGMKLKRNDLVVGMDVVAAGEKGAHIMVVMEHGYGKQSPLKEYKIQNRGGSGIKTAKITTKTGVIVMASLIPAELPETVSGDLLSISAQGQVIRFKLSGIPKLGRDTQGVRVMRFKEADDKIASVTII